MTPMLVVSAPLIGASIGWLFGSRRVKDRHGPSLARLLRPLSQGRRPASGPDETPEVAAVREALDHHWAPKNEERGRALSEALGRIVAFLRKNVRAPLEAATGKGDTGPLRDAASRALGGLDDLEFYLVDPLTPDEVHNLTKVVEQVTREFTSDWDIAVRMRADAHPVRAHVHRDTFMDAVYLLLHNAAQFGEGKTVDVTIAIEDGRAAVQIRDQGAGFSKEALTRAQDLFYSTSSSGLGLGIPFARKIIESFGGGIDVRNADEGGAVVTLTLPIAK